MRVPTLETPRLRLRAHTEADLPAAAAMWASPEVVRYIGGKPFTAQQSWSKILAYRGHWALKGFGYWAVEDAASGRFIGEMGFADFKRALEPPIAGVPELGWALAPEAHGQGYATEALQAIVAWGDRHFGPVRTVCIIDPGNAPSIRVAAKLGYREVQGVTYDGAPILLFERTLS